ncbi:hypothetical protein CTI12_AA137250 [Artemisia annua]|uniref:Uncharacterized protein n=1 Tax=Artemisia annua TaxID=35608 RepID=A0A2U1PJC6_ARTAN|nr:hypothetical protein CTI12_AA137250 [Artemisia annua]
MFEILEYQGGSLMEIQKKKHKRRPNPELTLSVHKNIYESVHDPAHPARDAIYLVDMLVGFYMIIVALEDLAKLLMLQDYQ